MKTIEITINEDGSKVTQDAKGFVGSQCMRFADAIKTLGGDVTETKKPEYNKAASKLSAGSLSSKV